VSNCDVSLHPYILLISFIDTYRRIAKVDLKFEDKEVRLSEEVKDLITRVRSYFQVLNTYFIRV